MSNRLQPASTIGRARAFFTDNPEEELTLEMIMEKFDCGYPYAQRIVQDLKAEGLIESLFVIRNVKRGRAS